MSVSWYKRCILLQFHNECFPQALWIYLDNIWIIYSIYTPHFVSQWILLDMAWCTPPDSLFHAWPTKTLYIYSDLTNSGVEVGFIIHWLSHQQLATFPLVLDFVKNESNFSLLEYSTFCVHSFSSSSGAIDPWLLAFLLSNTN